MSSHHSYVLLAALSLAMTVILQACGEPASVSSPVATPSSDNYEVTDSEVAFALEVLLNDSLATALFGDTTFADVEPGIVQDKNQQKTGVMLRLFMSEPISAEGDWLWRSGQVHTLSSCNAPAGVTDILATVDLASGELASLGIGPTHLTTGEFPFSYDCDNLR